MPPSKRARSYRAGNVRIKSETHTRAVFDVHNPFGRKQLGFHTPDVVLSMRKPRNGERYEGKYYVEPQIGYPGERRELEKHALAHALHIRLHHDYRIPFKRYSILFQFSHEFWDMFERRRLFRAMQSGTRNPRNPFEDVRKALKKEMDTVRWTHLLMRACATQYPSRKAIMEGVERLYANPSLRPALLRLSKQMDITPKNEQQTQQDPLQIVNFFSNDVARYQKSPQIKQPRSSKIQ